MRQALIQQGSTGSLTAHYDWIAWLLMNYYDPMYDYQLSRKQHRVVVSGTALEIREYLAQHLSSEAKL